MTLTQLQFVVALDTYRRFSQAAEACFVTQPALSMQLQKLEDELGVEIFDRSKQPIVPTDIGSLIIQQARVTLKESERIREIVKERDSELKGLFRLGVIPSLSPYLLPIFLEQFVNTHPKLQLVIEEIQAPYIIEKLKNDTLDAGLLSTPLHVDGLTEIPLFYEPFIAFISESHPLIQKEKVSPLDLLIHKHWIASEEQCFRNLFSPDLFSHGNSNSTPKGKKNGSSKSKNSAAECPVDHTQFAAAQAKPQPQFASGNIETLKKLVEQNFGMTILPKLAAQDIESSEKSSQLRTFEAPVPTRQISIVFGKAYLKRTIIEELQRAIRDSIPQNLLERNTSMLVYDKE